MNVHTNKQHKHPPRDPKETHGHHLVVAEERCHLVAVEAAHRGEEAEQRMAEAEHSQHKQHIASALGAVPSVVVAQSTASSRVRTERLPVDPRLRLWHELLGLRLGR
jgi:hypothetical protein